MGKKGKTDPVKERRRKAKQQAKRARKEEKRREKREAASQVNALIVNRLGEGSG